MGKDKDTKSRTEKESWVEERLFGLGDHYKTTISSGDRKYEGRGRTSEEAESRASDRYHEAEDDEDDEYDDEEDE